MWIRSSLVSVVAAALASSPLGCSSESDCLEKRTCTTGSVDSAKPEAGEGGAPAEPIVTGGRPTTSSGGATSGARSDGEAGAAEVPIGTTVGAGCEDEGERSCGRTGNGSVLACSDGVWSLLENCLRGTRCDSSDPHCAPIIPGCERLAGGSSFCDGQTRIICGPDLVTREEETCPGRCTGGTCVDASCGDGIAQEGEACDDGNTDEDDTCTSACGIPGCGDAIPSADEECDDGNDSDRDGCLTDCTLAVCGDGVVHEGEEACDDGNDDETDDCSSSCEELQLPPDIALFEASSDSIVSGASVTLSWDVAGADEVSIAPEVGVVSGKSITVSPTQTTTYTLTATNEHGHAAATARVTLVSGGRIAWIRHYEHTGFGTKTINARAATLNAAKQRLITTNMAIADKQMFIGEHSLLDGALLKWSDQLSPEYPTAMCQAETDFLIAGQYGQLARVNNKFEEIAFSSFEIVTGGGSWDYVEDIATASNGSIYAVGYSGFANAGFIASVPQNLTDPTTYLTDSFLQALLIDSKDRLVTGGRKGFLGIYSTTDLVTPANLGTLNDDDYVTDLMFDHMGNVIAIGTIEDTETGFLAMFSTDLGDPTWRVEFEGHPRRLAQDTAGNFLVLGTVDAAVPEDINDQDLVLDAFNGTGSRLWERIRVASSGWIEGNQVIADDRGNVYVVGGSSGKLDGAIDYTESRGAFVMRVY